MLTFFFHGHSSMDAAQGKYDFNILTANEGSADIFSRIYVCPSSQAKSKLLFTLIKNLSFFGTSLIS